MVWVGTSIPATGSPTYPALVASWLEMTVDNESQGSSHAFFSSSDLTEFATRGLSATKAEIIAHPNYVAGDEDNSYEEKIIGKNADILVIDHGHNDAEPDGDIDDLTTETFYGAMNIIIQRALAETHPVTIILVTSPKEWFVDEAKAARVVAKQLAVRDIAAKYDFKVIDPIQEELFKEDTYAAFFPDDVHPNQAGVEMIADFIATRM